jgi:type III pantothenate kinase
MPECNVLKMLLTLNVGNTTIAAAVFDNDALKGDWKLATRTDLTPDELGLSLLTLMAQVGVKPEGIDGVIIGSVVPSLQPMLVRMCQRYFKKEPAFLDHRWGLVKLAVREPATVGTDRIADCLAGYAQFGGPLLIIDFGTAITFNLVSPEGAFLGGAIAPEMELAAQTLVKRTAQLFGVELVAPESVIGRDTAENLQAGIVLGFIELVRGLIARFQRDYGRPMRVIATGGWGKFFSDQISEIEGYEPLLTLRGLQIAWKKRKEAGLL